MVGIIDSGIGGLVVLHKCLELCPKLNYIYLADNLNLPYGNKSESWLISNAYFLCEKLISRGARVIIFACNTLTAVAIKSCRERFKNVTFIGIEPAVKPASESGLKTLVLCTSVTFNTSSVIKKYRSDNLTYMHFENLAFDIEHAKDSKYLERYFSDVGRFEAVVLGCTHFNYIKSYLALKIGATQFFEASDGVAKRLKSLGLAAKTGKVRFLFTGKKSRAKYKRILKNLKNFKQA